MRKKYRLILFLFLNQIAANAQEFHQTCYFVNSLAGLNVRLEPSTRNPPLHILKYADVIKLGKKTSTLDSVTKLIQNDSADWIPIEFNNIHSGYIIDTYLSKNLKVIPENALELFYTLRVKDFEYYREENPKSHYFGEGKCYEFYSDSDFFEDESLGPEDKEKGKEYLEKYLSIELVDIGKYVQRKMTNPYELNQSFTPQYTATDDFKRSFYLPINEGMDSFLVTDEGGEAMLTKTYLGEIKKWNKYVVQEFYEEPTTYTIDKQGGKKAFLTSGYPYISPDGQYVISFFRNPTYNYDEATVVSILKLNSKGEVEEDDLNMIVSFKSWLTDGMEQAFWVSERELVLRAFPVDNYHAPPPENKGKPYYQYIKIGIK